MCEDERKWCAKRALSVQKPSGRRPIHACSDDWRFMISLNAGKRLSTNSTDRIKHQ
jgi:hypothetical protein